MPRILAYFITAMAAFIAAFASVGARAEPADIAAASRSVVRVVLVSEGPDGIELIGHGSGFAVAPDMIVTNAHVVAPLAENQALRIGIVPSQGSNGWFARIAAYSPRNDLALLKLTEKGSLPPVTLFSGAAEDGSEVYAVGYPGNVDLAQGLSIGDMVSPTAPVKTRGTISGGRSSKQFETILHTASIGAGNSGGPLLDSCGRVLGANSFGALSDGTDSEFYFAVSIREIQRFLRDAGVTPRTNGVPCRSFAEFTRSQNESAAGEKARATEEAATSAAQRAADRSKAERRAEFDVLAERDNRMALAALTMMLAMTAGAAAFWFQQTDRQKHVKLSIGGAALLAVISLFTWLSRPGFAEISDRADKFLTRNIPAKAGTILAENHEGNLICVLDANRSRITVSSSDDVPLSWRKDGCVNGKTQYGEGPDGWVRVFLSSTDKAAAVNRYDPATGILTTDRFLLDTNAMVHLQGERQALTAPACTGDIAHARAFAESQAALMAQLPETPNERLVYSCQPQTAGANES